MSHLIAVAVGPVQEFIAAARRTRDLWFGSHLLSQVSRAVATAVERHGSLIFPATSGADNVANVILAELNGETDPKEVAANARQAARNCWKQFAEETRGIAARVIRNDIWDSQVEDVVEFYAAWVPLTEDYQLDRARAMRLLAGRKNCRDFLPAKGLAGVPKSSLDGQRESVLKDGNRENWTKRLRLSPGEQLDVVGVVKRLGTKRGESHLSYPYVARVAAETWLQGVRNKPDYAALKTACAGVTDLNKVAETNYQYFPFEGTIIYKDRHPDLVEELGIGADDLKPVAEALRKLGGEPNPYLAILVADGDKMGEALSRLDSADDHRKFSQSLAEFAGGARTVANEHNGVLIYAGGDDVIAFVPVDKCLPCARKLHDEFGARMKPWSEKTHKNLTLSVGVAIGHFMENLEDLLEYGRTAEKHSKQPDRDGLAIHLHKRGGAPIRVRAKWSENPEARILGYAEAFNREDMPGKLAYELRTLADLYDGWSKETDAQKARITSAITQDVARLLSKKQPGSGKVLSLDVARVKDSQSLSLFAEELLVARLIATAMRQAGGSPARNAETTS